MLLYIDPGSGSLIVQAIIGGVLSVAFFFKSLRHRAAALFGKKSKGAPHPPAPESDDAADRTV